MAILVKSNEDAFNISKLEKENQFLKEQIADISVINNTQILAIEALENKVCAINKNINEFNKKQAKVITNQPIAVMISLVLLLCMGYLLPATTTFIILCFLFLVIFGIGIYKMMYYLNG